MTDAVIYVPFATMTFSPVLVAHDLGMFRGEGVKVRLEVQGPGQEYLKALGRQNGEFIIPTSYAVRAAHGGIPVAMVCAVFNQVTHRLVARPPFERVLDLKGRTVMVNAFGGTSHLETRHIMRSAGLDPAEVVFVEAGPGLEVAQLEALRRREVDAIASSTPYWFVAEREGNHVVADAPGLRGNWVANGIFGNRRFVEREPALIRAVQAALAQACALISARPAEAAVGIARWVSLDEGTVVALLRRLADGWTPAPDLGGLEHFVRLYSADNGWEVGDPADVIDCSPVAWLGNTGHACN